MNDDHFVRAAEYVRMSTDHQRYSIENQSALIRAYASSHRITVVRSYADPGRTGLTLRDRPALSQLLADVLGGNADFDVVLVYDVSRWGRFQDADESAHYEFLCRRSGIRVIYCAERFTDDGTPFGSVLKALKRAMAGEYSRELSVKVAAGKARIGRLGFRVGGIAGYGLRRRILEGGTHPGLVLQDHQRKSIQADRVVLVPGPLHEVQLVQRIYRDYIYAARSERQISDALNAEGLRCFGRPWSRNLVRSILRNEKYIGNNIVGQFCQRLRAKQTINPPETWVRCDRAFEPIVSLELFEQAARVRRFNEKTFVSHAEILEQLRLVWKREGKLTTAIINSAPELPSANTVIKRFGTIGEAYEKIGYQVRQQFSFHSVNRRLQTLREDAEQALLDAAQRLGAVGSREGLTITFGLGRTVEVMCCRYQRSHAWRTGWRLAYERHSGSRLLVACRMDAENAAVRDYLLLPRDALTSLPLFLRIKHEALVTGYTHADIGSVARALATA